MVWKAALILLSASLASSSAAAHPVVGRPVYNSQTSGAILMGVCKSQLWEPGHYDSCGSYLLGVIDGLAIAGVFCPRSQVGNTQLMQMAFNSVKDHPEKWDVPAISLIWGELQRQFPCTAKK